MTHLGDIKSGSTTCDDARFAAIRPTSTASRTRWSTRPATTSGPTATGPTTAATDPLERLATIRSLFFSRPGTTLGEPVPVTSQADRASRERALRARRASFATLHVVGSNDDLAPWTGHTAPTRRRCPRSGTGWAADRQRAGRLRQAAGAAGPGSCSCSRPTCSTRRWPTRSRPTTRRSRPLVQALIDESRRFHGRVYLFNGDSHRFRQDRPLAAGSPWLGFYGVRHSADNLGRVTVDGSDLGEADWLKVTVRARATTCWDPAGPRS